MAYCVVCYLVTALLFSLLILDLAALVLTVAPSKGIFKYTDLVYTGARGDGASEAACIACITEVSPGFLFSVSQGLITAPLRAYSSTRSSCTQVRGASEAVAGATWHLGALASWWGVA